MARAALGIFSNTDIMHKLELREELLRDAINHTYNLLDKIDGTLKEVGAEALSQTVELANLSSMLGNVFAAAIATHSNGVLRRNGPHKYPDLLPTGVKSNPPIEIKVALETNKPKGHLAKEGWYLTARYVLCDPGDDACYKADARGLSDFIWELRGKHPAKARVAAC